MGDFFKSLRFKILVGVGVVFLGLMLLTATAGGSDGFPSNIINVITSPIKSAVSFLTGKTVDRPAKLSYEQLEQENKALKEENRKLTSQAVDYSEIKRENEQYKQYLGLKEEHPDFVFEPADIISRETVDRFYSFTINKGAVHGVEVKDPVITPDGLVGYVSKVGLNSSTVTTILDTATNVGAFDSRSGDGGVLSGTVKLAEQGMCKLGYVARESALSPGDIVVTSGLGGIYPRGLVIGTIGEVKSESHGISLYATVKTKVDIKSVRDVSVLKGFAGQGGVSHNILSGTSSGGGK